MVFVFYTFLQVLPTSTSVLPTRTHCNTQITHYIDLECSFSTVLWKNAYGYRGEQEVTANKFVTYLQRFLVAYKC